MNSLLSEEELAIQFVFPRPRWFVKLTGAVHPSETAKSFSQAQLLPRVTEAYRTVGVF